MMSLATAKSPLVAQDAAASVQPVDLSRFDEIARTRCDDFAAAEPFPHTVIDDFLPTDTADAVLEEFPAPGGDWIHYNHFNERKQELTDINNMGARTRAVLDAL